MDIGTSVGLQATAIGIGMGALIAGGHASAMERVRADRQAREQATYDAAVSAALGNAAELGRLARMMAADLAEAHGENARLRRALEQRQAYIDRQRRAA
jgi:hypothetical protein